MKTYYRNDLKQAHMILVGAENEKEDYQMIMLRENKIPGILQTEVHYIDNTSHYYYNITGKTSFKTVHEKVHLRLEDMKKLVQDLLKANYELQKYMLDGNCILLEPEYIFYDGQGYYFCYYPSCNLDSKEEFHKLTEFFVREVDYKDEEGVHFAYTLHKATMEANYSIEQIMEKLVPQEDEQQGEIIEIPEVVYVNQCESSEEEEELIEEKKDFWEPVRRFLEKTGLRSL